MAQVALALLGLGAALALADQASDNSNSQEAASVLAGQVRAQGYSCDKVIEAHVDPSVSLPGLKGWILTCSNATYIVRLRPHMAAEIEPIAP